ncbi:MAG: TerC family protein [Acidimicrobiia bacterium]|nr:TerC family protein [Acidimicrobiia bacterium]
MVNSLIPPIIAAESSGNFVALDVGTQHWILLGVVVMILLAIDLFRHRDDHEPSLREALFESTIWVACGLAFAGYVFVVFGDQAFAEYLSGYLIEKALSVDNVFVWSMLFTSMAIPLKYQHRVLFYGIFGALVLRGIFIFLGAALLEQFKFLLVVFGLFLIVTGLRVIRHTEDEGDTSSSAAVKFLERFVPVSETFDGHKFMTRINGHRVATPLLAALVVVEFTDLVFAVDSVPAILAVSKEEFLVFSSNAFAILGLRAMYFLLADAKERFHYLNHGLGAILVFVGLKMAATWWDYHLNVWISLSIIAALLAGAILFSERKNRRLQQEPVEAEL